MSLFGVSAGPVQLLSGAAVVLSAAALILALFVEWFGRARVRQCDDRLRQAREVFEASLRSLQSAVDGLAEQTRVPPGNVVPAHVSVRPGMNLSQRGQILRMHRRGEAAENIAAILEVPLQEVELLLKIHQTVLSAV